MSITMKNFVCLVIFFLVQQSEAQISYQEILANAAANENLSLACRNDLNKTTISSSWFWLMVDAGSNIPSGIAEGNIFPMGNYDECLGIEEISTKFCKGTVELTLPFKGKLQNVVSARKRINSELGGIPQKTAVDNVGIEFYFCVVKACNAEDLNIIFKNLVHFDDEKCSDGTRPDLDASAIIAIIIFATFVLITIVSTCYEIYLVYNDQKPVHPVTIAFSLYTNTKKLFHLGNAQQLHSLNGLKSLSMLWVLLGHVYMAYAFVPLDNYKDVFEWLKSARSQYISGATVSVDTFLLIGGFLTVYSFQSTMDKGSKFNVPLYYLHRYLRLTPALAAMLLAHAALFNYLGSGPVWENTDIFLSKACREYWWSTLLYIQNYANPNGTCIPQSWYLSVDMQLFLVSPLILIMMRNWPIWGYITLGVTSVLSIVASFLIGWFFELNGQMSGNVNGTLEDYMKYYYMPTHTRMVPYLFGIMLGYAIYKMKSSQRKIELNVPLVTVAWIVSLSLLATCVYAGSTLQFTDYDKLANSFFIALMRPAWSVALCWVIFACVFDYRGPINQFLSLPIFQILSKLSYSIYLVHYSFIFMTNFTTKAPLHFTEFNAFHKFLGDFVCSLVIGIFWTLIFESPVIVLEKLLFGGKAKQDRQKKMPLV